MWSTESGGGGVEEEGVKQGGEIQQHNEEVRLQVFRALEEGEEDTVVYQLYNKIKLN